MTEKLRAMYGDGTAVPHVYRSLPNNTEVELAIYRDRSTHDDIIDPEARKEVLNTLLKRMKRDRVKSL